MILIHTLKCNMFREIALKILIDYSKNNSYLNISINNELNKDINPEDKNKITRIVYGTIQYQLYLSYILSKYVKKVKTYEKMLLLLSMYQHFFMDSFPDYAIVNEAVEIEKRNRGIKKANFINAVLKNIFSNPIDLSELDDIERLSIENSHPLWMVKMFIKQYGLDTTIKILKANNEIPNQCGRVNTLLCNIDDVLANPLFTKAKLSSIGVYYKGGNIALSHEYKYGLVTIQDESSQLVASYLDCKENDRVLDMCSAPGSKTTHIAATMQNKGHIDAIDIHEHKIKLIQDNLKRLNITNVTTYCLDSTKLKETFNKESYDCILLDAPCSGLGDLRRKPEIRYHDSNIMDTLIPLQRNLLENAYYLLKKGGRMIYSTCTINKKENEKQVAYFINKHQDLIIKKEITILPYEYHSDGFYMCLIIKEK